MVFLKSKRPIVLLLVLSIMLLAGCQNPPKGSPNGSSSSSSQNTTAVESSGSAISAYQALAIAQARAKQSLGSQCDVVSVWGHQDGTNADGKCSSWQIVFATLDRKAVAIDIEDGKITMVTNLPAREILGGAEGRKWIDSVEAAQIARDKGGSSFTHTVANPSTTYLLGRLDEIAWYGDKKAGVVSSSDQRPAWKVTYDNKKHFYIDAVTGQFIAAGSYANRP